MSVVVKVLEEIAKKGNPECRVDVFSYLSDFDRLWDINSQVKDVDTYPVGKTVILVWDGIPAGNTGPVDTTKYLTPIDWAVAFSLAVHRSIPSENNEKKYPNVRILVFDLNSHSVSHSDSVKLVNKFPKRSIMSMPWVQLFRPMEAEVLLANVLGKALDQDVVLSMAQCAQKESIDLSVVRNIWAAVLTRPTTPGDHHAIANLVGPLLLLDDAERQKDSHADALVSLLREVGLLSSKDTANDGLMSDLLAEIEAITEEPIVSPLLKKDSPWINSDNKEWKIKLRNVLNEEYGSLNLLLIDDQYRQGWGKVLCLAVGAAYYELENNGSLTTIGAGTGTFVKASDSIDWLLDLVESAEDRRFAFKIDQNADNDGPEILFLDLRLFSGKPLEKEVVFFEKISAIADKLIEKKGLPWPTFTYEEVGRVKTWCEETRKNEGKANREDSAYREALTFFPRILALTDMSLPIILFSSTGKRDIAEKLKDYGNIITVFDKPKFTVDIPEDIADQTKAKFVEAMNSAMALLQGRCAIKKIRNNVQYTNATNSGNHNRYVEVYIDEGGDGFKGYFTVGGVVLVYDNENDALNLNKAMQNTLVKYKVSMNDVVKNLTWCGPDKIDKRLSSDPDDRAKIVDQILPYIQGVFLKHAKLVLPIILGTEVKDNHNVDVLHEEHLDNLYLTLFKELADAAIYEFLPWYVGRNDVIRCKIFAATRVRTKDAANGKFTIDEQKKLKNNFGIEVIAGGRSHYYRSLTSTSFIPMASSIVCARQNNEMKNLKIEGAAGVTLRYEDKCDPDVRHAHYVADLMAHFDYISRDKKERDIFKKYFPERMLDEYNGGFKAAIAASKFIDAKDLVNALLCAHYAMENYDPSRYPESIIPKILSRFAQSTIDPSGARINQFLHTLTGEQFKQYSNSIGKLTC